MKKATDWLKGLPDGSEFAGKETMTKKQEEKLLKRLRIAESALWIMADRHCRECCYDKDDMLPTDLVSMCRHQAEVDMSTPNVDFHLSGRSGANE